MITFLRDIAVNILFRNRLSAIGSDKIAETFKLTLSEKEKISDYYTSPKETIDILEKAAKRERHKSAYGNFRKLFGDFIDWKEFFPDIEKRRQEVEKDILDVLESGNLSGWANPLYYDTNRIVNSWLNDVGSDNRAYAFLFGASVCYFYGPAEHEHIGFDRENGERDEYDRIIFKDFTSKGCSPLKPGEKIDDIEKYNLGGVFNDRSTVAVFEPLLERKLGKPKNIIGSLIMWSAVQTVKLHETGHAAYDLRVLDLMMQQIPRLSNDPDLKRMHEIYSEGVETNADIWAMQQSWFGTFAFWLPRFPKYPLTKCMLKPGYKDDFLRVRKFFRDYNQGLFDYIKKTASQNDWELAAQRAEKKANADNLFGGNFFETREEKVQDDLILLELAEIFWRNRLYIEILRFWLQKKAAEFNKLKRSLCQ